MNLFEIYRILRQGFSSEGDLNMLPKIRYKAELDNAFSNELSVTSATQARISRRKALYLFAQNLRGKYLTVENEGGKVYQKNEISALTEFLIYYYLWIEFQAHFISNDKKYQILATRYDSLTYDEFAGFNDRLKPLEEEPNKQTQLTKAEE